MTMHSPQAQPSTLRQQFPPQPESSGCKKVALFGCVGLVVLTFVILLGLGLLIEAKFVPDTEAVRGNELREATIQELVENGVLEEGETIQYFYSAGLFSYLEDGNLFTDRRVISYSSLDSDDPFLEAATFDEIAALDISYSESFLEDSMIEVTRTSGDVFYLIVSAEEKGDRKFFKALEKRWRSEVPQEEEPEPDETESPE